MCLPHKAISIREHYIVRSWTSLLSQHYYHYIKLYWIATGDLLQGEAYTSFLKFMPLFGKYLWICPRKKTTPCYVRLPLAALPKSSLERFLQLNVHRGLVLMQRWNLRGQAIQQETDQAMGHHLSQASPIQVTHTVNASQELMLNTSFPFITKGGPKSVSTQSWVSH